MSELDKDFIERFGNFLHKNAPKSETLVQIIELYCQYGNIWTVSEYAKRNNLTYNGVIKTRTTKEILGVKCVIENNS